ncbi:MAG: carboxypeptidase regulatory-like domain-containing protein [Microcystaceae cyanobacterium]
MTRLTPFPTQQPSHQFWVWPLVLLISLLSPSKTLAHAVETDYFVDDDLEITSIFSTGEPLKEAEVEIYAPNNPSEPWMKGNTDEQGRFSFKPDSSIPGEWEVRITDTESPGHGDILTVPVNELGIQSELISAAPEDQAHFSAHYSLFFLGALGVSGSLGGVLLVRRNTQKG